MDTITSPTLALPADESPLEYRPWRDSWPLVLLKVFPVVYLGVWVL